SSSTTAAPSRRPRRIRSRSPIRDICGFRLQPEDHTSMTLESQIDELYKLPLAEFTAARNALAKSLSGDDSKRVKSLEKPTVVPWSVNQLFWRARPVYDRLMKAGAALRQAQLAALKGRSSDVRAASEEHRKALGAAATETSRLASATGARPDPDPLNR